MEITLTQDQLDEIQRQTQKLTKEEQMEKDFLDLWNGCTIKFDFEKYPKTIFLMKDGEIFFELNFENMHLWCSYNNVWLIFKEKYGLKYDGVQFSIRRILRGLKLDGLIPVTS